MSEEVDSVSDMPEKMEETNAKVPPEKEPPRDKMIDTAMKFLLNPQVRSSPLSQKRAFLQKKGLTEEEIELAVERSGTRQDVPKPASQAPAAPQAQVPMATYPGAPHQQQMVPYVQPPPPPPSRTTTWRDYMAIAVIISGVSFGVYKLVMKFLTPWLKSRKEERERMERIEASIQELNRNVTETVAALEKSVTVIQVLLENQETQLSSLTGEVSSSKALASSRRNAETTEIKAEITSLKGLLLNRHQFPATPQRTPIPAWQRSNESSNKSNSPLPAAEMTNGSASSSSPAQEPITNGDSSVDNTQTPTAPVNQAGMEPVQEGSLESANQEVVISTPDEYSNGSVEPIGSQATAAVNGTS